MSLIKAKLMKAEKIQGDAEEQLNIQIEVQARHRAAVEEARMRAESSATGRASNEAKRIQELALALSGETRLRIEGHMSDMRLVEDKFI